MPPIRSFIFKRCALLIISISLDGEIMSLYSHYTKKGLVYIAIIKPFSCQPSSYIKYTKLNTYILCNMRLMPLNKYRFFYYAYRCVY